MLQLLAEGGTLKGIANELKLTPRTIAYHKYRIMQEFGFEDEFRFGPARVEGAWIAVPEKLQTS